MGSAYDRVGDFLGSVQADSMREVFEKLEKKFPDAARIEVHQAEAKAGAADPMLQFFQYAHLPEKLQAVSEPFCTLAQYVVERLPRNPERTVALRKLLEAKDCAVRALIYEPQ